MIEFPPTRRLNTKRFFKPLLAFAFSFFFCTILQSESQAEDKADTWAKTIITMRAEVDALNSALREEENELKNRLSALAAQKAELELLIQKESLRSQQLALALERQKKNANDMDDIERSMKPLIDDIAKSLKAYVQKSLPFHVEERLSEIKKIVRQVRDESLKPSKALARFWSFIEDEIRLGRENGIYRQIIVLDGQELLAEVARIGMVMMAFKTPDGQTGYVKKKGESWAYHRIENEKAKAAVLGLFDSLKKQIRQGYFVLPNMLPQVKGGAQ